MSKKWYEIDMNNSKNRCCYAKQRHKDLQEMFKSYIGGFIPPPSPDCDVTFCDNFETGWFENNEFTVELFDEDFDTSWFVNNNFTIELFDEDFEDVSWD